MVHVSQLDSKRIAKASDVVKVGDEIMVKALGTDKKGRQNSLAKKHFKKETKNAGIIPLFLEKKLRNVIYSGIGDECVS